MWSGTGLTLYDKIIKRPSKSLEIIPLIYKVLIDWLSYKILIDWSLYKFLLDWLIDKIMITRIIHKILHDCWMYKIQIYLHFQFFLQYNNKSQFNVMVHCWLHLWLRAKWMKQIKFFCLYFQTMSVKLQFESLNK
jgi:hypothetical protein